MHKARVQGRFIFVFDKVFASFTLPTTHLGVLVVPGVRSANVARIFVQLHPSHGGRLRRIQGLEDPRAAHVWY